MKRLLVFSLILLLTSVRANNKDMFWSISTLVMDYYYTYFKYPEKVDDLINFSWAGIMDNAMEHAYAIGMNHEQCAKYITNLIYTDSLDTSTIPLLDEYLYLQMNKDSINIIVQNNSFIFKNTRDSIAFLYDNIDICKDKNIFGSRIFRHSPIFYASENYLSSKGSFPTFGNEKYENIFYEETNRLKRKYKGQVDSISFNNKIIPRYALLRYERGKGLSSVCPDDSLNFQSPFLIQLDSCLTDFVKDKKEIEKIVFLTKMVK